MTDNREGATPIIDQPGPHDRSIGGGASESRLDTLLAEDLAVDLTFTGWFLTEGVTWKGVPPCLDATVVDAHVRLNLYEDGEGVPADAHGETDIELTVELDRGGEVVLLIEDKLWAPFQARQPERYARRAEARGGASVLVAPRQYLAGRPDRAAEFDGTISIETIIDHLRDRAEPEGHASTEGRRMRWRARLLEELITRPGRPDDDPGTVEFTNYCCRWFEENDKDITPNRRHLRTAGQGWLWFEVPIGLAYKVVGWSTKPKAAVDLYVGDHGFAGTTEDLSALVAEVGAPDGFHVTTDTSGNVVLRCECARVDPKHGPPTGEVVGHVVAALEACSRAGRWLRAHEARFSSEVRATEDAPA